ncbi:glycosyltransferase [Clostridium perfringens]|uniref:glycosyltransferase n=1 Tax=Clostridium perfringens TaxID=1502 RepID=UPI003D342D91
MKKILVSSFDMEVGGVERSLISMLNNFDYENNKVDLMLYSHTGDFMNLLTDKVNLLDEIKSYSTFRKGIVQVIKEGNILLGLSRLLAKYNSKYIKNKDINNESVVQMQLMWKYALPFLPKLEEEYDVAISYLWPHYFIANKVKAKKKIAWIHTDYSTIETDVNIDLKMWNKFDYIIAVSEECKNAFLKKYPSLHNKVKVMENITSPEFIKNMSQEKVEDNIIKDNSFKVVSVARLSYAKGIDNAVRTLKILHDRGFKNIKWYVIGYGGDGGLIRELIKENNLENSFILLGKKINPYPYMKIADIYVQPSRYEGKAVTVTEARILCRPTIITNYPTAKSQLTDGLDGLICESTIDGIAKSIVDLYKNFELRERLSINCKNINYGNTYELEKLYKLFK